MSKERTGIAQYQIVGQDYLKQRKLRGSAGWVLLWALGVGAVISGDYFGWNFGLLVGGFWGLAIATVLMALGATFFDYLPAVLGVALFLLVAILYFLFYSRKCLVAQAPEEEVALIAEAQKELAHK